MKRSSFRRRMIHLFVASIAVAIALQGPGLVNDFLVRQRFQALQVMKETYLPSSPSIQEATAWMNSNGFVVFGVGPYSHNSNGLIEHGQSLNAEKQLAEGSLFWRAASVKVFMYFSATGDYRRTEWWDWPFPAGAMPSARFDGVLRDIGAFPPSLAIVVIIILNVWRRNRRRRNLCMECAYPIGTSDVCTECGTRL